jgi:hypothetical protein
MFNLTTGAEFILESKNMGWHLGLMKFNCYVSSMSFHCHLSATFYANMIERSLRFGSNKMALLFILSLSF